MWECMPMLSPSLQGSVASNFSGRATQQWPGGPDPLDAVPLSQSSEVLQEPEPLTFSADTSNDYWLEPLTRVLGKELVLRGTFGYGSDCSGADAPKWALDYMADRVPTLQAACLSFVIVARICCDCRLLSLCVLFHFIPTNLCSVRNP